MIISYVPPPARDLAQGPPGVGVLGLDPETSFLKTSSTPKYLGSDL